MYTHPCDLYAERFTCMRNLMFENTLQDIELKSNHVVPKKLPLHMKIKMIN